MPVGPPRAREVSKTDSRKKTSATTRPNNEPPSETMLLEGWMTKRIAPELFSRRYVRLSASGSIDWSKTHASTSKRHILSLGGQVSGVSTKLELFKGVHCFILTLNVKTYRDDDVEHQDIPFESLVFGSTEKHEAKKWLAAIHEELHHRHSVDWFRNLTSTLLARNRAARRVAIAPVQDISSLSWLTDLKVRDWDGEWQRCLAVLSPVEKIGGGSHERDAADSGSDGEGIWESYRGHDEQAVTGGSRYDLPCISESVALKQKSNLLLQFQEFSKRVLKEITTIIRQKAAGEVGQIPKIMRELRTVVELQLPDWLEGHGSLLSGDEGGLVEDTVLFVVGGCCFELVSFSEASDTARALSHGIDALHLLQRYAAPSGKFILPLCCCVDQDGFRLVARALPAEFGEMKWWHGGESSKSSSSFSEGSEGRFSDMSFAVKRAFHLEVCPSVWLFHDTLDTKTVNQRPSAPSIMIFSCPLLLPPNIDSTAHPLSHTSLSSLATDTNCDGLLLAIAISTDVETPPSLVGLPLNLNNSRKEGGTSWGGSFSDRGPEPSAISRREQAQQRMVEVLMAVGAVLRVPPEEVRCHQTTQCGFTLWYASGGSFDREGVAANAAWTEAARSKHVPSVAVALKARVEKAAKLCAVNQRASQLLAGLETIRGPVLLTARMDIDFSDNLARAPIRFRRELLNAREQPFSPFDPSQRRRSVNRSVGGKPERSLRRPPPRRKGSKVNQGEEKSVDWITGCGLKGVAVEVRQVAKELGERLRCAGNIEGRKVEREDEQEVGPLTIIDDEGEEEELGPPPITNEVVVFHGAHIVSLAHEAGINVSLLPELKAALPRNEVSVHHIIVSEMLARAAKHALRCRLLTEKSPPFDGGLCDSEDEAEVEVCMAPVDIDVTTALLNEILFDPSCPLEVLESDMTKISDMCDSTDSGGSSGSGGFTSAIEEAQKLIDSVKSRGRLVIGGHMQGGESGDWDPVLKANIDSELWQRRRKAQVVARRLGRKHDFWWRVESRAYLQLGPFGTVGNLNLQEHSDKVRHICEGIPPIQLLPALLRQLGVTLSVPVLRNLQNTGRIPPLLAKHVIKVDKTSGVDKTGLSDTLRSLAKLRHHRPTSLEQMASGSSKPAWASTYADLSLEVFGDQTPLDKEKVVSEDVTPCLAVEGLLKSSLHILMQEDETTQELAVEGIKKAEVCLKTAGVIPVEVNIAFCLIKATLHVESFNFDEPSLRRAWRSLMLLCPAICDGHTLDLFSAHPIGVAIARLLRALAAHNEKNKKEAQSGFEVFDLVEVRDEGEEWEPGCVESLDEESGRPRVVKEGYETAYLWEEVRRIKDEDDTELDASSLMMDSEGSLSWLEVLINTTSPPMHWDIVNKDISWPVEEDSEEQVMVSLRSLWGLIHDLLLHRKSSLMSCSPQWYLSEHFENELGQGKDAAKVGGKIFLGGNLFGFSADDKGKISKKSKVESEDDQSDDDDEVDEEVETPIMKGLLSSGNWVIRQLSCGYRHTALVTTTGLLLTCGHGETGRLGHGDEIRREYPTIVSAFLHGLCQSNDDADLLSDDMRKESIISVACGREHTVAVGVSGKAYSWGWGEAGRLGIGEVGATLLPTPITKFKQGDDGKRRKQPVCCGVACGREHTLLLTTAGLVFASGPGYGGRLGLGQSNKDVLYPTIVNNGNDLEHELVICAAAGDMHSAVTTQSGCVYTWGFGATGALGHGDGDGGGLSNQFIPKRVDAFLTNFADFIEIESVSCGAYHTLALSRKGEVFSFGDGESGALGLSDRGDNSTHRAATPILIPILHELSQEIAGSLDTTAYGEKLVEGHEDSDVGADDGSGKGCIASIDAGHLTSSCVDKLGRVYTWGCAFAEDGVQPRSAELVPRKIEPKEGYGVVRFRSVGMGGYHTVALTEVYDRWGSAFDPSFNGLEGLQLQPAHHDKMEEPEETIDDLKEKQEEEADEQAKRKAKAEKLMAADSMIGKLRIAPGAGKGGDGRSADTSHGSGKKQTLFVAAPILSAKAKDKNQKRNR